MKLFVALGILVPCVLGEVSVRGNGSWDRDSVYRA